MYGRRLVLEWAEDEDSVDALRKRTADHFHGSILYEVVRFFFLFPSIDFSSSGDKLTRKTMLVNKHSRTKRILILLTIKATGGERKLGFPTKVWNWVSLTLRNSMFMTSNKFLGIFFFILMLFDGNDG